MQEEKYSLEGVDGNAFSVMAYVSRAMRNEGYSDEDQKAYRERAMSSDYTSLLMTSAYQLDEVNARAQEA